MSDRHRSGLGENFGVENAFRESGALRIALGIAVGGGAIWWLVSHGHIPMSWVVLAGVLVSAVAALVYHRKVLWILSGVRFRVRRLKRRRHVMLKDLDVTMEDVRHHVLLLGPTGTGKTTALERLALAAVKKNAGMAYFDPKDGLAIQHILERLPRSAWDRVVLIEPARDDFVVGLNPLDCPDPGMYELVAEQVVGTFQRLYAAYWRHATDRVMRAAVLTLLQQQGSTLLDIPVLLTDKGRRREWTQDLSNPILRSFWEQFERWTNTQRENAIGPLLTKLEGVLLRGPAYRMLGQQDSMLDLDRVVNGQGILLADLSKGKLGEDTSSLIGSLLVARLWQAIMRRAGTPEEHRKPFAMIVDEFQNFTHSFGTLAEALAESRSFRVGWLLAHQYRDQITREMWSGVEANTLTKIVFAGPDQGLVTNQHLKQYQAAIKHRLSPPAVVKTKPPARRVSDGEELALHALAHYGRPRATVDAEIQARSDRPRTVDATVVEKEPRTPIPTPEPQHGPRCICPSCRDARAGGASCEWCGKSLDRRARGRGARFCSDTCRQRAHRARGRHESVT